MILVVWRFRGPVYPPGVSLFYLNDRRGLVSGFVSEYSRGSLPGDKGSPGDDGIYPRPRPLVSHYVLANTLAFCANNISPVMALNTKTGGYRPLPVLSLARFPFPHYTAITHPLTE
ncbi:unnamed protein product [Klebsiella pneumoniae]|nr:unnamed protein product [Klebsiella pneumoniae]